MHALTLEFTRSTVPPLLIHAWFIYVYLLNKWFLISWFLISVTIIDAARLNERILPRFDYLNRLHPATRNLNHDITALRIREILSLKDLSLPDSGPGVYYKSILQYINLVSGPPLLCPGGGVGIQHTEDWWQSNLPSLVQVIALRHQAITGTIVRLLSGKSESCLLVYKCRPPNNLFRSPCINPAYCLLTLLPNMHRADSRLAPSQWETSLQSNAVSHWLGANIESALLTCAPVLTCWPG